MKLLTLNTLAVAIIAASTSLSGAALTLTGNGIATQLNGTTGTVDVVSIDDQVGNTAYLGQNGVVNNAPFIEGTRVQYDLFNHCLNEDIFSYTVYYEQGVDVLGAGVPSEYIDKFGVVSDWSASNYMMRFDKGYGVYDYELLNGGQWAVEYNPDNIKWILFGNGFEGGTATGRTDLGTAIPTFSILFPESVNLELQRAVVAGNNKSSAGLVLSATSPVPVPAAAWLFGSAIIGLAGVGRKRR